MKKMIFGFAALASFAALATTVQSANTFGVLKVTSEDAETIISVPWLKVGGGNIDAGSLVLTSNLKQGDELFAYDTDTSKYYKWTLSSDAGSWSATATTFASGESGSETKEPSAINLARGVGLILNRCGTAWTADTLAKTPIYLYGQYEELTGDTAISTPTRNSEKMVTTVIAPPTTVEVDLNTIKITGAKVGDVIKTKLGTSYKLCNTTSQGLKWCSLGDEDIGGKTVQTWSVTGNEKIPAGTGALYMAEKGSTGPTIYWIKSGTTTES